MQLIQKTLKLPCVFEFVLALRLSCFGMFGPTQMFRELILWFVAMLTLTTAEDVTWPGCPCSSGGGYQNCSRIIRRGTPDTAHLILNLKNCNISAIAPGDFPLRNAWWINLKNNNIERIDADVFKSLANTWHINLESNKIRGHFIHAEAFKHCSSLRGIGFSGNDMRGAPSDLVQGLPHLELLYLSNSSLREVPMFVRRAFNLKMLLLDNNAITLHDPYTFSSLNHLQNLFLEHNQIEFIAKDIFKPLTSILRIRLGYNRIRYVPEKLFTNLNTLVSLNLQNNFIEYVSENMINNSSKLEEINVSKNRITQLPEKFFSQVNSLKKFDFSANPWQCGCLHQFLIQVIKRQINYNSIPYNGNTVVCVMKDFVCHRNSDYFNLWDRIQSDSFRKLMSVLTKHTLVDSSRISNLIGDKYA